MEASLVDGGEVLLESKLLLGTLGGGLFVAGLLLGLLFVRRRLRASRPAAAEQPPTAAADPISRARASLEPVSQAVTPEEILHSGTTALSQSFPGWTGLAWLGQWLFSGRIQQTWSAPEGEATEETVHRIVEALQKAHEDDPDAAHHLLTVELEGRPRKVVAAALYDRGQSIPVGGMAVVSPEANGEPTTAELELFDLLVQALAGYASLAWERQQAEQLASTDGLTGLLNRRELHQRLYQEVARADRTGESLALLMVDMDDLKKLNDTYGHPVGDTALVLLAQALREGTRPYDTVARYGGDEFAAILSKTPPSVAQEVGTRMLNVIAEQRVPVDAETTVPISAAVGVATYPHDAQTASDLLVAADTALLEAKRKATKRVVSYAALSSPEEGPMDVAQLLGGLLDTADTATMVTLSRILDTHKHRQRGHSEKVGYLAMSIGRRMGLEPAVLQELFEAALFRDLGQLALPHSLLGKVLPLSEEDWAMLREHPEVGYRLLVQANVKHSTALMVRAHHERYDGTGYPSSLARHDIPLPARILAAADATGAMLVPGPYRPPKSREECRRELEVGQGKQWDPEVIRTLLGTFDELLEAAGFHQNSSDPE